MSLEQIQNFYLQKRDVAQILEKGHLKFMHQNYGMTYQFPSDIAPH